MLHRKPVESGSLALGGPNGGGDEHGLIAERFEHNFSSQLQVIFVLPINLRILLPGVPESPSISNASHVLHLFPACLGLLNMGDDMIRRACRTKAVSGLGAGQE